MKRFVLLALITSVPNIAWAQEYKPDFNCSVDHSKDSIATMLCENSDAAKHELIFDQTYYALRQIVGKLGWKALKQEAIADDEVFKECIAPDAMDGSLPKADPQCYISKMDEITQKYKARLSGSALEEASRPIDRHIALQQKFIDLGYLPAGSIADGVYGEGTREAISTWQRVSHRPSDDGFISDADAAVLSGASAPQQIQTATAPPVNYVPPQQPVAPAPTDPISRICHGQPQPMNLIIGFNDPYAAKGRCYQVLIASRFGRRQWIDENTVLIIDSLPSSTEAYETIVQDPNGHIQYGKVAVVIGVDPIKYTAASGEMIVAPTLEVLKYVN
ncbi:peptidoglycan-binding protein [Acetobacter orientalis]|uniref:peptidoglycan-binding domain-containing protein n=1 Tax=Acetobacter orientalis TaxID=146474 RepID=UPI00209FD7E6|nr:peptidoglycan-binding domain-containing protein [Acetobacter orientalis]MCP1215098.1 peptidoglycan-binding protein [Acetobacter orientalis]MCP1218681.1 peptidoglycan-binding protein [Acetobacter orientalis]